MNKSAINTAVLTVLSTTAGAADAANVTRLVIRDVGSNTANAAGAYSSALDGISGAFRFANEYLNVQTYAAAVASFFTGDAGTGAILGGGAANPTGSFSTGFLFLSIPFIPFTFGNNFDADITNGVLNITSLDFGGNFGGNLAGAANFNLPPDIFFPVEVLWLVPTAVPGDFNVAFRWGHDIQCAEDPSLMFTALTTQWVLEGCISTNSVGTGCGTTNAPVPVPAAAWLLGSGLAGLAGVARRRKAGDG